MSRVDKNKAQAAEAVVRNPGTPFNLDWLDDVRVNLSAVERRTKTMTGRRSIKKEWQVAWLFRALNFIDLTTLAGDDTPGYVERLCAKAKQPIRSDIVRGFGLRPEASHVGAVCVYHNLVPIAVKALGGKGKTVLPVAAVSTGFPAGQSPFSERLREIRASVKAGATEIDVVISRAHVLTGRWRKLYDEVVAFREACGEAHMKTILATGELATLRNVYRASLVCMMAGADFIKTSTGKEGVNAILPVGLTMVRAIREYHEMTNIEVGFKPAGGIRTAKQALSWLTLIKEELGNSWLTPERFRLGASSLLTDIERQLEYHLTGGYSAAYRHPTV